MVGLIQAKLDELASLCRRYRVRRLEVFGSGAGERFDADSSDLDFLVEFAPLTPCRHADAYFALLEGLQKLFARTVDLVETRAVRNPYFLQSIKRTRSVVYAA